MRLRHKWGCTQEKLIGKRNFFMQRNLCMTPNKKLYWQVVDFTILGCQLRCSSQ